MSDDWFDAIEDGVRGRVRGFIETMLEEALAGALSRPRYGRLRPGEDEAIGSMAGNMATQRAARADAAAQLKGALSSLSAAAPISFDAIDCHLAGKPGAGGTRRGQQLCRACAHQCTTDVTGHLRHLSRRAGKEAGRVRIGRSGG